MRRQPAERSVYRSVGWVAWHALFSLVMTLIVAGFAFDVWEPLAAVAAASGLSLAARASAMSVVITDEEIRVRNLFRTHTVPTEAVQSVAVGPSNPWASLSWDQLTILAKGHRVRASSCCEAWWWKGPSRRLRDAVRADIERRTGRRLPPLPDAS